jgi:hypothetical protein
LPLLDASSNLTLSPAKRHSVSPGDLGLHPRSGRGVGGGVQLRGRLLGRYYVGGAGHVGALFVSKFIEATSIGTASVGRDSEARRRAGLTSMSSG